MEAEHRRPLVAFLAVLCLVALIVGQNLTQVRQGLDSLRDGARIVALRSQLIAQKLAGRGGMASVAAPRDTVESLLTEGLSVAVLDLRAFGGQAGASARIENYLGFPTGISGQALAGRAFVQAEKFGAEIAVPAPVARLRCGANRPGRASSTGPRGWAT